MQIPATPSNRALAAAVSGRMKSDASLLAAKASCWRAIGFGAGIGLAGLGVGAAFLGYSYITDTMSQSQRIADAIVGGLSRSTVRATGTVGLDTAGSSVKLDAADVKLEAEPLKLDPAAQVKLDAPALKLDPNAEVKLAEPVNAAPKPSQDQLKEGDTAASQPAAKVVTDFTVFKNVSTGTGRVVTGWTFGSSEQKVPTDQYCYYTKDSRSSVSTNTYLAMNGMMLADVVPVDGIDPAEVAKSCVWFDGKPTRRP
jgi:hypothetical protein